VPSQGFGNVAVKGQVGFELRVTFVPAAPPPEPVEDSDRWWDKVKAAAVVVGAGVVVSGDCAHDGLTTVSRSVCQLLVIPIRGVENVDHLQADRPRCDGSPILGIARTVPHGGQRDGATSPPPCIATRS